MKYFVLAFFLLFFFSFGFCSFETIFLNSSLSSSISSTFAFGFDISIWNNTLVVGAPNIQSNSSSFVFIFNNVGNEWIELQRLNGSCPCFGISVSIYENFIAIGSPGFHTGTGSVDIFFYNGSLWVEQQVLTKINEFFGFSVSIYGNYLIVGAPPVTIGNNFSKPAAYLFYNNGTSWIEQQKLIANNSIANDNFAFFVSIYQNFLAISSQSYIYIYINNGNSWNQIQEITECGVASVLLSENYLFIGCPIDPNFKQGSAYIFSFNGTLWIEQQKLIPNDGLPGDLFGVSISFKDGFLSIISFPQNNSKGYIFTQDTNNLWINSFIIDTPYINNFDSNGGSIYVSSQFILLGKASAKLYPSKVYYSFQNFNSYLSNHSSQPNFSTIIISIMVGFFVLLIIIIIIFLFIWIQRQKKRKNNNIKNIDNIELSRNKEKINQNKNSNIQNIKQENNIKQKLDSNIGNIEKKKPSLDDLSELTDIQIGDHIGSGSFGDVFKGTWFDVSVALKKLKNSSLIKDFEKEALRLNKLNHPNIVRFYGIYREKKEDGEILFLVTEFVELGCLDQIVNSLNPQQKFQSLLQISNGLQYLQMKDIIHRDLALRNLLVKKESEEYLIKISDLGMSTTTKYYSVDSEIIPIRWCSPEVLKKRKFSFASDIWAFGVTIWEIYTNGKRPYAELQNAIVIEVVITGTRLPKPESCPNEIFDLVQEMWNENPQSRPTIQQILSKLEEIKKELE